MIKIIVAVSENGVIGGDNSLIWNLPNDMKRFKQITTGNAVVMGRKTYESIGKPLPNRRNIIISKDTNLFIDECEVVNSIEESLMLTNNDCFFIGGGEIYKQVLPLTDIIYLTKIHEDFNGDTYFPELNKEEWFESMNESFNPDDKNKHKYSFIKYERYKF
jgi:dihydrofolate reductase